MNSKNIPEAIFKKIDEMIKSNRVILFMKGVPTQPQCGYSAYVSKLLNMLGSDYEYVDVLEDQEIREAIKAYSSWPTIPQLYIDGKFIGGKDIIFNMHANGKFESLIKPTNDTK